MTETACHNPTGAKSYRWVRVEGKRMLAHRAAWQAVHGPISDDVVVRHKCDNPPCDEITHLEIGSRKDNQQDMVKRGRFVNNLPTSNRGTHCSRGHEYTGKVDGRGAQLCMVCERERKRLYMKNRRAEARS